MGLLNQKKKKKEKNIMKKTAWVLAIEEDLDQVMKLLCGAFGISGEGGGNTMTLNNGDLYIKVTVCTKTMSEELSAYVEGQAKNVWSHFYQVETPAIDTKVNLLHQLRMTCSVVELSYAYEEDESMDKEKIIWRPFLDCLPRLKGVFIAAGGASILGENGRLILSEKGETEGKIYMPYEKNAPVFFSGNISTEGQERRKRSLELIKSRCIYVPSRLPLLETEEEAAFRPANEIAGRLAALLAVSLYSECLLGENMEAEEARGFVQGVLDRFEGETYLSPKEKSYLENPQSTREERVRFSWQYENLFVMEWALGFIEELPFPDHLCDVPFTVRLLNDFSSLDEVLESSSPKSSKELLDAADLIYCLDWACVDARVNGLPAPAGMDGGVTMERHKSLNWLMGFDQSAPWDEVDTPT